MYLPRAEDDKGLAATAADARVAVHTILTGGLPRSVSDTAASGFNESITNIGGPNQNALGGVLGTAPDTPLG